MFEDVNSVLMGAGGKSATFKAHGDQVWGTVVSAENRQQTSFESNELLFWDDGKPRMQIVITLQTEEQEDENDDGLRRVYIKVPSQLLRAMRQAITKAGANGLQEGGKFLVRYMSDAEPKKRGMSGEKQYFCKYEPPAFGAIPEEGYAGDDDVPAPDDADLPW